MQANGVWKAGFETQLDDGRGHAVTIDEPARDGGQDTGTTAYELLILSLAGCITTIFHFVANKRRVSFDAFRVSLHAERDHGAPTLRRVHGTVEVRTNASQEEVDTVLRLTLTTCPVGMLFDRAHVPVEVTAKRLAP